MHVYIIESDTKSETETEKGSGTECGKYWYINYQLTLTVIVPIRQ